ncbi:hypothetical protein ATM56_002891, partial [Salmonella enterica subsp. enterica serovar Isangi]|nr:hypothetical protein [Salmonella enterica]EDW5002497.1 hypothetical protein [Salmonella enterica subsp. enterica serovar Isangi]
SRVFLYLKSDEDENLRGQEVRPERSERTPEGYWQSLSTRSKSSAPARRKSAASGGIRLKMSPQTGMN